MIDCADEARLQVEWEIDGIVAEVFARLSPAARARFVAAEQAWLQYRGKTCSSRGDVYEGGSASEVVAARCLVELDRQHLADLRTLLAALDGNR